MIIISILYIGLIIHILYLKINNAKRNNRIYTTSVFLHSHAKMIYIGAVIVRVVVPQLHGDVEIRVGGQCFEIGRAHV